MKSAHRTLLGSLAFLGSLASLGGLAACNGAGSVPGVGGSTAASTASNLFRSNQSRIRPAGSLCNDYKLNLVNKTSQIEDKNVYFLLEGRDGPDPKTAKYIYLVDAADGKTEVAKHGKDVKNFNLSQTPEFRIPNIWAGRFYVSYDHPLVLPVNQDGRIIEPAAANEADPNYNTPWDFIELNKRDCNGFEPAFAPNYFATAQPFP